MTPEELAELEQLNKELGPLTPESGLSVEEEAELAALNAELDPPKEERSAFAVSPEGLATATKAQLAGMGNLLGAGPKINAGIGAGVNKALGMTGDLFLGEGETNPYADKGIKELYNEDLARLEGDQAAIKGSAPIAYGAGEVTSAIAMPGRGIPTLAAQGVVEGALNSQGDFLNNPNQLTKDMLKSGAFAGGATAGMEGVARTSRWALDKAKDSAPVQWLTEKAGKLLVDLPEQYTAKLITNPELANPKTYERMADEVADSANTLQKEIDAADEIAWQTLSDTPKYVPNDIIRDVEGLLTRNKIAELRTGKVTGVSEIGRESWEEPVRGTIVPKMKAGQEIKVDPNEYVPVGQKPGGQQPDKFMGFEEVGGTTRQVEQRGTVVPDIAPDTLQGSKIGQAKLAFQKAKEVLDELGGYSAPLTEKELRGLRIRVDNEINWDKQENTTANALLLQIRGILDNRLKTNPAYSQAMEPVSSKINQLDELKKQFRLVKDGGNGLMSTDTTLGKIKSLSDDVMRNDPMRPNAQRALEDVNPSAIDDLETNKLFREAGTDITRGSKRTTPLTSMGSVAGYAIGGPVGGAIGGVTGFVTGSAIDKFGRAGFTDAVRSAAGGIKKGDEVINSSVSFADDLINKVPLKYREAIRAASQKGGKTLAVTHFLLSQQDPEYQQSVVKKDE